MPRRGLVPAAAALAASVLLGVAPPAAAVPVATPSVDILTPASPHPSTTVQVQGASETGATITLYGAPGCAGPALASGVATGGYTIQVTVARGSSTTFYARATMDGREPSACSTTSRTYTQQDPDTQFGYTPPKKIFADKKKINVHFEFGSATYGSTYECRLDSKPFKACVSGDDVKVKRGKHTFEVRALHSGVSDLTPASYTFKVKKPKN